MIMKCFIATLLFCLLSAGLATASPPSYNQLAKLPVIRFGEPVPESNYILMFPAGQPITPMIWCWSIANTKEMDICKF
jgi:hypothetical protein